MKNRNKIALGTLAITILAVIIQMIIPHWGYYKVIAIALGIIWIVGAFLSIFFSIIVKKRIIALLCLVIGTILLFLGFILPYIARRF